MVRKPTVFLVLIFGNFGTLYLHTLPCVLYLKNEEENIKNERYLPSEKEESQTLAKALIFASNAHNESDYLTLPHANPIV